MACTSSRLVGWVCGPDPRQSTIKDSILFGTATCIFQYLATRTHGISTWHKYCWSLGTWNRGWSYFNEACLFPNTKKKKHPGDDHMSPGPWKWLVKVDKTIWCSWGTQGVGGIPRRIGWGCAAHSPKTLPNSAIFPILFLTWQKYSIPFQGLNLKSIPCFRSAL